MMCADEYFRGKAADIRKLLSFIDSIFIARLGDETDPLVRVEIKRGARTLLPVERRAPFSLLFSGPGPRYLRQENHRLRHEQFGDLDIFLVPGGECEGGFRYRTVFS